MKKNFRIKAGLLALATAIFTLSVRDIKADYDYNTSDTTNYTSYYGLRNTPTTPQDSYSNDDSAYTYSRRNYRETPSYEDSYRSSNRDYYSSSPYRENYNSQELARYQQLEANRKALITEYKRLKTINEERQLTPESSQQLEKLKSEAADLGEQVNQATSQYTEDYHGNSAKLKEQFSTYQENLSKIDIPEDFKVKHYYTFQDLDRLDKERKSQLQNSYSRDYRWINTTLESLTDGIQRLNSDLVKHLNQNAYTNNNNVQILVDSEQNIRKNLEIVQEDLRRREEAKRVKRHLPQPRSSRQGPTLEEFKNSGYNSESKNYKFTNLTGYYEDSVNLTGISDKEELLKRTDEAYRLRAKQILFTVKLSEMGEDISAGITRFINLNVTETPNARGVSQAFSWSMQGFKGEDEVTVTLTPKYYMTGDQYTEYLQHIQKWTRENIYSTDTDLEKVEKIQDYIMTNYHYARTAGVGGYTKQGISVQTPYAFLKDSEAVCQAYAQMFKDMGHQAGLDVYYIQGFGDPYMGSNSLHAWNIVKVGGKFYHIDLTWNDTIDATSKNRTYTLRGNNFMHKTHRWKADYEISDVDYPGYSRPASYSRPSTVPYTRRAPSTASRPVPVNYESYQAPAARRQGVNRNTSNTSTYRKSPVDEWLKQARRRVA